MCDYKYDYEILQAAKLPKYFMYGSNKRLDTYIYMRTTNRKR